MTAPQSATATLPFKFLKALMPAAAYAHFLSPLEGQPGSNTRKFIGWVLSIAPLFILAKTITFGMQAVAARLLGPSEFGLVNFMLAIAGFISIPMQLGFAVKINKFLPLSASFEEERDRLSSEFWAQMLCVVCFAAVALAFGPILSEYYKIARSFFFWALVYAAGLATYTYMTTALAGLKMFTKRALAEVVYAAAACLALAAALIVSRSAYSYIIGLLCGTVAGCIFAFAKLHKWFELKLDRRIVFSDMHYIAAPLTNNIFTNFLTSMAPLALGYYLSSRDVGIYSIYAMGAITIPGVISGALNIVLSTMAAAPARQPGAWHKFYTYAAPAMAAIAAMLMLVIYIIFKLVGRHYPLDTALLFIFSLAGAAHFLFGLSLQLLTSADAKGIWQSVTANIVAGIMMISLALFLIPRYSLTGAAMALLCSRIAGIAVTCYAGRSYWRGCPTRRRSASNGRTRYS